MLDHKTIYLAPPCFGEERFWCQDDAPVDCDCMDGPHSWARYERATTKSSEGALLEDAIEVLEWYGEQARLARLVHSEGDAGRHALANDGGNRAIALLAKAGKARA